MSKTDVLMVKGVSESWYVLMYTMPCKSIHTPRFSCYDQKTLFCDGPSQSRAVL